MKKWGVNRMLSRCLHFSAGVLGAENPAIITQLEMLEATVCRGMLVAHRAYVVPGPALWSRFFLSGAHQNRIGDCKIIEYPYVGGTRLDCQVQWCLKCLLVFSCYFKQNVIALFGVTELLAPVWTSARFTSVNIVVCVILLHSWFGYLALLELPLLFFVLWYV